mgnify:FL=1
MTHTTKHTPGPWKYCCTAYDELRGIPPVALEVRAETNGMYKPYICDVRSINSNGNDNTIANAALIAAAPAMYEALVETMKVLRSLRDNKEEWYTLVTPELLTAWDKNKAALAQAEGR